MIMFRYPFIITIKKYLPCTYCFTFEFNRTIFKYKGRFWFKKKLWLFNKCLHFTEIISSKTTHFRQCRLYMYACMYVYIYECFCSLIPSFHSFFLQWKRTEEKKDYDNLSRSLFLCLVIYTNIAKWVNDWRLEYAIFNSKEIYLPVQYTDHITDYTYGCPWSIIVRNIHVKDYWLRVCYLRRVNN
jgi:hypothetical protein